MRVSVNKPGIVLWPESGEDRDVLQQILKAKPEEMNDGVFLSLNDLKRVSLGE